MKMSEYGPTLAVAATRVMKYGPTSDEVEVGLMGV